MGFCVCCFSVVSKWNGLRNWVIFTWDYSILQDILLKETKEKQKRVCRWCSHKPFCRLKWRLSNSIEPHTGALNSKEIKQSSHESVQYFGDQSESQTKNPRETEPAKNSNEGYGGPKTNISTYLLVFPCCSYILVCPGRQLSVCWGAIQGATHLLS